MDFGEIPLSDAEFERLKLRLYDIAGIALSDAKRTLVVSRLSRVMRGLGTGSFTAYLDHLERAGGADIEAFVNALTTNLTRFWREEHHFDHLCAQLPGLAARRARESGAARPRLRL